MAELEPPASTASPDGHAWDEYKLLQDKVDKIGAFRFQIKGWTIAFATAATIGLAKLAVDWMSIGAVSALFLLLYFIEYHQVHLSSQLQQRLGLLEVHLAKGQNAPGIVRAIRRAPKTVKYWMSGKANGFTFYVFAGLATVLPPLMTRFMRPQEAGSSRSMSAPPSTVPVQEPAEPRPISPSAADEPGPTSK